MIFMLGGFRGSRPLLFAGSGWTMGFTLKDVQEWLGHSDIKMTANVYSHLDNGRKNAIAAMLVQNVG